MGQRDEADRVATELLPWGHVLAGALCTPFPTLADTAWAFRDLGRERELVETVLGPDVIRSPWNDVAHEICEGDFARAADLIDAIGHTAAAAYARLRAAESAAAKGDVAGAAAHRAPAESFYSGVGAVGFLARLQELGAAAPRASSRG
jgi:hypothetical protein